VAGERLHQTPLLFDHTIAALQLAIALLAAALAPLVAGS
jgi:hypothetical protein